ncbi:hypothetical protein GN956_G7948 [Arapaima gigas]
MQESKEKLGGGPPPPQCFDPTDNPQRSPRAPSPPPSLKAAPHGPRPHTPGQPLPRWVDGASGQKARRVRASLARPAHRAARRTYGQPCGRDGHDPTARTHGCGDDAPSLPRLTRTLYSFSPDLLLFQGPPPGSARSVCRCGSCRQHRSTESRTNFRTALF